VRCPEALAGRFCRSRQGLPGGTRRSGRFPAVAAAARSQVSGPRVLGRPWCPWCPWMRRGGQWRRRGGNRRNVALIRIWPARC